MFKRILRLFLILIILGAWHILARAQTSDPLNPVPVPTIITFESSLDEITMPDAESGLTSIDFTWHTVNARADIRLTLDIMRANDWVALHTETDIEYIENGEYLGTVEPPQHFGPLTYRLTLRDNDDNILSQQFMVIPLAADETQSPEILNFRVQESADVNAVNQREAIVGVSWEVANRPPGTNLVFEQIFENGQTAVNIELPRENLWVPSVGTGVVRPFLPGREGVLIRMSLVDMQTGETLVSAEQGLTVTGTLQPISATPTPVLYTRPATLQPPTLAGNQPRIMTFFASPNPVPHDGLLNLTWETTGAPFVELSWRDRNGDNVVVSLLPPTGSRLVDAGEVYLTGGSRFDFRISLTDNSGNGLVDPYNGGLTASVSNFAQTDLQIDRFEIAPNPVERSSDVTVTWEVSGASRVIITRLDTAGRFTDDVRDNLPASGEFTYTLPEVYTQSISFNLSARDENGVLIHQAVGAQISHECAYQTFIAPVCPISRVVTDAAYQRFQNGFMVWRSDSQSIFVVQDNGIYEVHSDTWTGQAVETAPPPDGFIAPQRGFGWLWVNNPHLQESLGWATGQEISYSSPFEVTSESSGLFTLPTGARINLAFNGRWQSWGP